MGESEGGVTMAGVIKRSIKNKVFQNKQDLHVIGLVKGTFTMETLLLGK